MRLPPDAGKLARMDLREAWERNAADWVRWAREPGFDSYWRFHRERFLDLVPVLGRLTHADLVVAFMYLMDIKATSIYVDARP